MDVVERIVRLPVEHQTWGETRVTALEKKLPFEMGVRGTERRGIKSREAARGWRGMIDERDGRVDDVKDADRFVVLQEYRVRSQRQILFS